MDRCLICGREAANHLTEQQVLDTLARFARVYRRLREEQRNPRLQTALVKYMAVLGMPCTAAVAEGAP